MLHLVRWTSEACLMRVLGLPLHICSQDVFKNIATIVVVLLMCIGYLIKVGLNLGVGEFCAICCN